MTAALSPAAPTSPPAPSRGPSPAPSPSEPGRGRLGAAVDLVPLGLAIIAEAAWITVAGGLIAEFTLQSPTLGIPALAAFVLSGVLAGHFLAPVAGERWPSVALFLTAVAGMIGWLSSPLALSTLVTQGVLPALGVNVSGWVAGLALLRGFAHARLPVSAATLATVYGVGVPCLAIAALAGGMVAEPHRQRFLADATVAVIVFAGSTILALAIARLTAVGVGSGFDWRRNPTWVGLLVVLVITTLAIAVPASVASPLIALAAGAAVGPLLVIGLIVGFTRRTLKTFVFMIVGAMLVVGVFRLLDGGPIALDLSLGGGGVQGAPAPADPGPAAPIGLLVVVIVAMIIILILARLWARRSADPSSDLDEERQIDRGEETESVRPRRWRFGGRGGGLPEPQDAIGAYLRLLADIDRRPAIRRDPVETPAAHAARLRAAGQADLSLDLLAADYALARFGGVGLTGAEDRRAVARWRRLKRTLGTTGRPPPQP